MGYRSGQDHDPLDLFPPLGDAARYGTVKNRRLANDIEDMASALVDEGAQGSVGYVGTGIDIRKHRAVFVVIGLCLITVLLRTTDIQLTKGEEYRREAETNRVRTERITSERGLVYDRRGTTLVTNTPILIATITPADLPAAAAERRRTLSAIADIIDEPPASIEERLSAAPNATFPVPVSGELTHAQAVLLSIAAADHPGVAVSTANRRTYALGDSVPSLSHVMGYEGKATASDLDRLSEEAEDEYRPTDTVGKAGIERTYETLLRGTYGVRRMEVDARGGRRRVIEERQPQGGKNLVLTIDTELQRVAEAALRKAMKTRSKRRGSVIVLQPKTGEILALVSLPAFDDNAFSNGIRTEAFDALINDPDKPLFPRAVSASLPAGSTFKLVVGAAALEEKIVTPESTVFSSGGISVDRWFFPDWKAGGHGTTNLAKAIAESVNTYFYVVGGGYEDRQGLGVSRITDYASRFGFGRALGIDLPGEGEGFLPSPAWKQERKGERWYIGDTYHLAIGQGDVLVTPLQIASMTAVFANGGDLMVPHVVNAVTSADGKRTVKEPEVAGAQVVSEGSVDAVRRGMRLAVTSGSARSLGDLPVAVAAKTGTAQWKEGAEPHAWFTSFAPYKDPSVVITVTIEEGGEGSVIAAPVAKEIYAWLFGKKDAARILDTPPVQP